MGMNNKKCKICGCYFHACQGCGLTNVWEYKYCSESCWKKSQEYITTKFVFTKIYNKLKDDSLHGEFVDVFCIANDDFNEYIISDWIMGLEEEV